MLKFFMSDGKWGANDVAEGVDYPRILARFRTRNMTFRLTIFTVVVQIIKHFSDSTAVMPNVFSRARFGNVKLLIRASMYLYTDGIRLASRAIAYRRIIVLRPLDHLRSDSESMFIPATVKPNSDCRLIG